MVDKAKLTKIVAAILSLIAVALPEAGVDIEGDSNAIAHAAQVIGGVVLTILGAAEVKKKAARK